MKIAIFLIMLMALLYAYAQTIIGVPWANIASISGVTKANIGKINGVEVSEALEQVAAPTFTPDPDPMFPYEGQILVNMYCATEKATIYYEITGDGPYAPPDPPDPTDASTLYTGQIILNDTCGPTDPYEYRIKAIAYKTGLTVSDISSVRYYLVGGDLPPPPPPEGP
jgi:hypothetical protein